DPGTHQRNPCASQNKVHRHTIEFSNNTTTNNHTPTVRAPWQRKETVTNPAEQSQTRPEPQQGTKPSPPTQQPQPPAAARRADSDNNTHTANRDTNPQFNLGIRGAILTSRRKAMVVSRPKLA
ncbi:hypothetical protein, partial [Corynebacterium sp. H113]